MTQDDCQMNLTAGGNVGNKCFDIHSCVDVKFDLHFYYACDKPIEYIMDESDWDM